MGNTIKRIHEKNSTLSAPSVNLYIHQLDHHNAAITDAGAIKLINELFESIHKIKRCGEDERRELWLCAQRGPIEDYGDFEELKDFGDVDNYEEFENLWRQEYPEEVSWYHLVTVEHNGYKAVFLRNRLVLEIDPRCSDNNYLGEYLYPFIQWLINECEVCVDQMKNDTYNSYISEHLPWRNRTGTILRSDYWKEYPEEKEYYFEDFNQQDRDEFINLMDDIKSLNKPKERVKQMTSGQLFKCCALGYAANHYEGCELSYKEQYRKHADGRDEGLMDLDADNAEEFDEWYNNRERHGGHPWEVCRGGNSTHIDLFVMHDEDGYYLHVRGKSWGRAVEAAKFYLALYRSGVPVTISEGRAMADRFLGIDKIGIVPEGVFPRYCESYFPKEEILDFMNLYLEDEEKILKYINWQEIPKQYLA